MVSELASVAIKKEPDSERDLILGLEPRRMVHKVHPKNHLQVSAS